MDNAGENIYIEQAIRSDPVLCEMGTVIEYTAPYTPQQNGKVERESNERFPHYLVEHVLHVMELNYLPHNEKKYFGRHSETHLRKKRFCIHKAEKWDLRIMPFSEKMHLMLKTSIRSCSDKIRNKK